MIVAAAMMGGILPIQAQEQAEEFTVATLNVDGLPDSFLGISINPHGPGDKYTPEIADYLLQKDYDLVGFQENFNYYDCLFPPLEASYQYDECKGKISLSHFALPFLSLTTASISSGTMASRVSIRKACDGTTHTDFN